MRIPPQTECVDESSDGVICSNEESLASSHRVFKKSKSKGLDIQPLTGSNLVPRPSTYGALRGLTGRRDLIEPRPYTSGRVGMGNPDYPDWSWCLVETRNTEITVA